MKELEVPEAVDKDEHSVELIRAFVANGAQWTSINPYLFRDREFSEEKAWGMFLADTVRHLARAISEHSSADEYDIQTDISEALITELENYTTDITGGFKQ